jgi:hypothetical protein
MLRRRTKPDCPREPSWRQFVGTEFHNSFSEGRRMMLSAAEPTGAQGIPLADAVRTERETRAHIGR